MNGKPDITIGEITASEFPQWAAMRQRLWPHCTDEENATDIAMFAEARMPWKAVFVARAGGLPIGFAEICERSIADSCGYDPVAHLEGWYIEPDFRQKGVGGALVSAAVEWARGRGYTYFSSDVEAENIASQKAHEALGFQETGRAVNYNMRLKP